MNIHDQFRQYQVTLDKKHDEVSQLAKVSKDLTSLCKKIIFSLHRYSPCRDNAQVLNEIQTYTCKIANILTTENGLVTKNTHSDITRVINSGIEEFIEAKAFFHFQTRHELISLEEIRNSPELKNCIQIRAQEYILGLTDLAGELMRYSVSHQHEAIMNQYDFSRITSCSSEKLCEACFERLQFLRKLFNHISAVNYFSIPGLANKLQVMHQSIVKMESELYDLQLKAKLY